MILKLYHVDHHESYDKIILRRVAETKTIKQTEKLIEDLGFAITSKEDTGEAIAYMTDNCQYEFVLLK